MGSEGEMKKEATPATLSADMEAMQPYFRKVETILGGTEAMRAATQYLPRFAQETETDYKERLTNAKFTNIFGDIVENLAQRPFSKEVTLAEGAPEAVVDFIEDVDGRGNSMHVFSGDVFFNGLASGFDWILVDYTRDAPANASIAEERKAGVRPYWVRIPASSMIAVYSATVGGNEEIVHARYLEPKTERAGFEESTSHRVRVLNREKLDKGYGPATWEIWEEIETEWAKVDEGVISIGVIPMAPFLAGRRIGSSWQIRPPMRDAADLQIEHYQQESGLKHIRTLTAFPMLSGNGVSPPTDKTGKQVPVPVGPKTVLYAPPGQDGNYGQWSFIEPSAESLNFLAADIKETARELRELGRQPLTAQSGNLTVITTAVAAEKGNAAIQAWALNLKDALENALVFTAMWLKVETDAEVMVNTDFSLAYGDDDSFDHIRGMYDAGLISRDAALHEAKRRGILDAAYDADEDAENILGNDDDEFEAAPAEQAANVADAT
jgi:hypothetical protein